MGGDKKEKIKGEKKEKKIIKEDKKKNNTFKPLIGMLLFIIIIFGFTIGNIYYKNYKEKKELEKNRYNGFPFYKGKDGFWHTRLYVNKNYYDIPFYYHPKELINISSDPQIAKSFINAKEPPLITYISVDPDASSKAVIGGVEISKILGKKYNMYNWKVKSALLRPINNSDIIVKNCVDAKPGILVIELVPDKDNYITAEGNCVILGYNSSDDAIKVADRFAYELLTIMP